MSELKPCPFCGAEMNIAADGGITGWHKVDCFLFFITESELDMTDDEISDAFIPAWNRRANNE